MKTFPKPAVVRATELWSEYILDGMHKELGDPTVYKVVDAIGGKLIVHLLQTAMELVEETNDNG